MLVDCNTQQHTQLNSSDYHCGVFEPCGGVISILLIIVGLVVLLKLIDAGGLQYTTISTTQQY